MKHDYPTLWTEETFNQLPEEDNRYEWKLGQIKTKGDENNFRLKLTKEVGAFANSFGGTLFIGISDDRTIAGVPKIWKGNQTFKQWLENVLPSLFEMRLQQFRVTEVVLSSESQARIGEDNCVLAVDVLDSQLAPHQSTDKKYYYRVSGNSEPAPHHYLAFLWGRENSNMSQVVEWWFSKFLDPLINLLGDASLNFKNETFPLTGHDMGSQTLIYRYSTDFVRLETWDELVSSDAGEYFLLTFPSIDSDVRDTRRVVERFLSLHARVEKCLTGSEHFRAKVLEAYKKLISREPIDPRQFDSLSLQDLFKIFTGQLGSQISNYPQAAQEMFVSFVAYCCLPISGKLEPAFAPNEASLMRSAEGIAKDVLSIDSALVREVKNAKTSYDDAANALSDQVRRLKVERIELAQRYTATFGN